MATYTITRGISTRLQIWSKKFDRSQAPASATATVYGDMPSGITAVPLIEDRWLRVYLVGTTNDYRDKWACVIELDVSRVIIGGERITIPLDIELTGDPVPDGTGIPSNPPSGDGSSELLTFRAARMRARAGQRIRKLGDEDRWLAYDGNWKLTIINPLTGTIIAVRVPRYSDQSADWYTSMWQVL